MNNKLGEYIKKYREIHNMSLREFANKCGLSHAYINKLEKGIDPRSKKPVIPTMDTLEKIATATNISLKELLIKLDYFDKDKYSSNDEYELTPEEKELLEKIKEDPELSILFHDLKNASKKKIKQLLKTWKFIQEEFDEWEDEEK